MVEPEKQRMIDLNGKGKVPSLDRHHSDGVVSYQHGHEPMSEGQLLALLGCALEARDRQYASLTEAIENLRKILRDEGVLK